MRNTVSIVPDVAGEVIEIAAEPNKPLSTGTTCSSVSIRAPMRRWSNRLRAQLALQEQLLANSTQLKNDKLAAPFDLLERQAAVDNLNGQLQNARWNLEKTTVRAPGDGFVTQRGLTKGWRALLARPSWPSLIHPPAGLLLRSRRTTPVTLSTASRVEIAFKFAPV